MENLVAVTITLMVVFSNSYTNAANEIRRDGRSTLLGSCSTCLDIRLTGGCSGTLEVRTQGGDYATATDKNFGANEAAVACRQLDCSAESAQRGMTDFSRNDIYQGFGFTCDGTESSFGECQPRGARVTTDYGIELTCSVAISAAAYLYIFLIASIIAVYLTL